MNQIKIEVSQATIKEIYKKTRINFLLFAIISFLLIIGFIFSLLTIEDTITKVMSIVAIIFASFLFIISLCFLIALAYMIRKSKESILVYEVSFNLDHMKLVIYEQEEKQMEKICKYDLFKKYVLTSNYVVVYYKDGTVIPFNRDEKIIKLLEEKGISRKNRKVK